MTWVKDNLQRAKKIAKTREDLHINHASHRPLSNGYEVFGVFGEIKFEDITGYPVDENGYIQGDNGIDFQTIAGPVDVKTARKAYNLIIERGKVYDFIYVLAQIYKEDVILLGWEYGRVMREMPTKDFGYGVINHYKHNSRLNRMEELYEMFKEDPKSKFYKNKKETGNYF